MFRYYGRKYSKIDLYPEPKYNLIIEPFAGSASYALRYYTKRVILVEKDPLIYGIWDYIINKATPKRILKFPILQEGESTNDYNWLTQPEKDLIGFFIRTASRHPGRVYSGNKGYNKWNEKTRKQLSEDILKVKHWKIIYGSYEDLKNYKNATWFIDPPYQGHGGSIYKKSNRDIDYKELGKWCKSRNGQVIVCENDNAKWLPFKKLFEQIQCGRNHIELIWTN